MTSINNNVGVHGPIFEQYVKQYVEQERIDPADIKLSPMDRLEIFMGDLEEALDYSGGITGVSTVSGALRIGYGLIQMISAVALRAIGIFGSAFASTEKDFAYWEKFNRHAEMHVIEGVKNIGRGAAEMIPGINLFFWIHIPARQKVGPKAPGQPQLYMIQIDNKRYCTGRNFYDGELKKMMILKNQKQATASALKQ